ncbi:hypothetical protein QE152_g35669 [Popillia japonica]|uniref:Uncharacterized protein n=1 Tax=Popillia japonica TaxID=7064 RepID=A0AAW1IET5_POPJA
MFGSYPDLASLRFSLPVLAAAVLKTFRKEVYHQPPSDAYSGGLCCKKIIRWVLKTCLELLNESLSEINTAEDLNNAPEII